MFEISSIVVALFYCTERHMGLMVLMVVRGFSEGNDFMSFLFRILMIPFV